jgi:hypothetical protein
MGFHEYAQRRAEEYYRPGPDQVAVKELFRLATRSPIVNHCLAGWRQGLFPSFEAALVAMACELAKQNAEFVEAEVLRWNMGAFAPGPVVVPPEGMGLRAERQSDPRQAGG